jgi:hypothetical protein
MMDGWMGDVSIDSQLLPLLESLINPLSSLSSLDVALDLLKRRSGIVWGPGRFAVLLRGGDVRRLGNPAGAPSPRLTPGNAWGYPANCKIPLSRSPSERCIASYAADPFGVTSQHKAEKRRGV